MATELFALIVLITCVKFLVGLEIRPINYERNAMYCEKESKDPYFDIDLIVRSGQPWRIYYTWNIQLEDKCLDMTIKNATPLITNRFWSDMHEYVETQPVWDAATLYTTLGFMHHEMLLFVDQGPAGSMLGVPNVIKNANIAPMRGGVPLLKFFLKVLHDGKYLLMMDCKIGVSTLLSQERPPNREEITQITSTLDLGLGSPACLDEKKKQVFNLINV